MLPACRQNFAEAVYTIYKVGEAWFKEYYSNLTEVLYDL
jgi:hypothetical protein